MNSKYQSDEFLLRRLEWKLNREGRTEHHCIPFDQLDEACPLHAQIKHADHLGIPAFVFITDEKNWSVIGTVGTSGCFNGLFHSVKHSDTYRLQGASNHEVVGNKKQEIDTLRIVKADLSVVAFKTPPGAPLFTLWGACLMMQRLWRNES